MPEDEFETHNIGMAAFLSLHIDSIRMEWRSGSCYWVFPEGTLLSKLVSDYHSGKANVDPRRYFYQMNQMRKDMWEAKPNAT